MTPTTTTVHQTEAPIATSHKYRFEEMGSKPTKATMSEQSQHADTATASPGAATASPDTANAAAPFLRSVYMEDAVEFLRSGKADAAVRELAAEHGR